MKTKISGGLAAVSLGALALAATAAPAAAADGWARYSGTLRAGPGSSYPAIQHVRSGEALDVVGCLRSRSWCDVVVDGERGWYPGSRIVIDRDGRRVVLPSVAAAVIGLSIIGFDRDVYWRDHYRERRFPGWHPHRPPGPPHLGPRPDRPGPDVRPPPPDRPGPVVRPPPPDRPGPVLRPPRPDGPGPVARPPRPDRPGPVIRPDRPTPPPAVQRTPRPEGMPRGGPGPAPMRPPAPSGADR